MDIALIVGFSLLLALGLAASILVVSHYTYSKNRLFSKTKYSVLWIVLCGLLSVLLLVAGVLFCIEINAEEPIAYSGVYAGLSFACFGLSTIYLIALLLIPTLTNKNKISFEQMLKVDYQSRIDEITRKIGDVEALKTTLRTKHTKYYEGMLTYYESILNRAKSEKISAIEKMADIVTFNDAFTHK